MAIQNETIETRWNIYRSLWRGRSVLPTAWYRASASTSQYLDALSQQLQMSSVTVEGSVVVWNENRGTDASDQQVDGWLSKIREAFYSEPMVESVFVGIQENEVDIWIVIPNRDINVVRHIAERQNLIMTAFSHVEHPVFFIDFHVVYRAGRSEEQLIPQRTIRLLRQA